ncbi:ATP-binding protein [Bradyrhizobium centrosematis]|uniref:ATP-binding protein n=1 Tax=Bradyrhizobium centrosematis TaxID=1300039 RepID=UPI002167E990|nr:AAA family ATPase [Bradyrhizobium centrosematis]MCS3763125.1 class 3 adenylate cyclase/energy-coupling factor transporter ATP-binding protein EcfA2 [Bradyrhizobium centrosematis]MCS3775792.1 class 3 adenylate cyclase/energy-coupling factor transporter ATP-binding protein EcfA2 [Bradyrhizobium centrosematis]
MERRHLTVMFVDLVGSTQLGRQLDPEDLRHVISAFSTAVTTVIKRFDGFVARFMGDGVLAYFGYPTAHEADAERAISAALEVGGAIANLPSAAGPSGRLSVRVGIASGLVVVGELLGTTAMHETAAIGDTPNLAARLQSAAEADAVVICELTKRLAGGLFEYQRFDPGPLKGRPPGELAWRVLGPSSVDNRFEALHPWHLRLVGRDEEVEFLQRRWQQVNSGEGRVVFICGEPGIGKSRLVASVEQLVRDGEQASFRFSCSPLHQHTPLYPLIRQLQRVASFQNDDTSETKRAKLRRSLSADASPEDIMHFADVLSISDLDAQRTVVSSPQSKKEMTFAAILRHFETLARHAPIAIIFEDLHWADPTTLDLLVRLVEHAEHVHMLLVVTSRRVDLHPVWSSRPHVTMRLLNSLDRRSAATLVKEVAGNHYLPQELVDRIVANSDGVPLFIEELTKLVLERDSERGASDKPIISKLDSGMVPTSLHASLMSRLDRLPVGKEIAQTGSVVGREFSFDLLQTISDKTPVQIENSLRELVDAQLIIPHGQPPEAVYVFKHALVQEAAYSSLLRERRAAIHLKLAEVLEKDLVASEGTHSQVTAWHFAEAGMPGKAVSHYLKAAEHATGRFALAEMVSHLRNALCQLDLLPDSIERRKSELPIQIALGRALIDHEGSGSDDVRRIFERAIELCEDLNDTDQMIRAHDGLVNFYFTHSSFNEILRFANELFEAGGRAANRQAQLIAKRSSGFAHLLSGRFAIANGDLRSFLDMYDASLDGPEAALTTRDPKVSVCTILGICLTAMGQSDSGTEMSMEGVKHAEMLNHQVSLILGLRRACVQRIMLRDDQGVRDLADRIFQITSEYETFKGARDGIIFRCWGQFHIERSISLLDRMEQTIEHFEATKHWAMLPFFMSAAAELRGQAGDSTSATALLSRASELVSVTGEQWCTSEILRLRALFCARNEIEKHALLEKSLATAVAQGAILWQLRTATNLAELWQDQGNVGAAHALLAPLCNSFLEGKTMRDLFSARTLLAALETTLQARESGAIL